MPNQPTPAPHTPAPSLPDLIMTSLTPPKPVTKDPPPPQGGITDPNEQTSTTLPD